MSNFFWKSLYLCFSGGVKCLPTSFFSSSPSSSSTSDRIHRSSTLTKPKTTTELVKNFNSLYHDIASDSTNTSKSHTISSTSTDGFFLSSSDEYSDNDDSNNFPDISAVYASQRFFFSCPGRSNSIFESPETNDPVLSGGVAVHTYSPDPFTDFRRSMQEMVDAHALTDVKKDWEFLNQLLSCYLALNPRHTHKFIVSAFADLLLSLAPSNAAAGGWQKLNAATGNG